MSWECFWFTDTYRLTCPSAFTTPFFFFLIYKALQGLREGLSFLFTLQGIRVGTLHFVEVSLRKQFSFKKKSPHFFFWPLQRPKIGGTPMLAPLRTAAAENVSRPTLKGR